uniref:Putative secreted protein n=1 Tax=Anopheles darlingi TaxID=43151 RepID=A0A2M4DGZ2_ANODA
MLSLSLSHSLSLVWNLGGTADGGWVEASCGLLIDWIKIYYDLPDLSALSPLSSVSLSPMSECSIRSIR